MKCFIGLGTSLGDRTQNLERAAAALSGLAATNSFRISPVYETPAMMPEGAPVEWATPYLNSVAALDYSGTARELLNQLKGIELGLGRTPAQRWAPRIIDLDLLVFGDEVLVEESLQVPHPGIFTRSFVLDPLKDLAPHLSIVGYQVPVVLQARKLAAHTPWIMGIVNLTPDSFSDGGENESFATVQAKISTMVKRGVQAIDLGAESTRPGAAPVSADEEWRRLAPTLEYLRKTYGQRFIRPFVSVDTHHASVAVRAIEGGADAINDVSGLADPAMVDVLKQSRCQYVLMHSMSIPADPKHTLPADQDPLAELKAWLNRKLEWLDQHGVATERVIFDPGIGFGKTPRQSIAILKRMHELTELPIRLLVGHSRKSFMRAFGMEDRQSRDAATLAISLELARQGVDILRVHDFESHAIAFRSRAEVLP